MNAVLCPDYEFDASAKRVICNKKISRFLLILNATDGVIIFNPANPATVGTVKSNSVELTYDTTSMSDRDDLYIFVERDIENEDQRLLRAAEESSENSEKLLQELRLLNERFEEAYETGHETPEEEEED